jgi:hypothetical protein
MEDDADGFPTDFAMKVRHFERLLDCAKPDDVAKQFQGLADSLNGDLTPIRTKFYFEWDDEHIAALLDEVRSAAKERGKLHILE